MVEYLEVAIQGPVQLRHSCYPICILECIFECVLKNALPIVLFWTSLNEFKHIKCIYWQQNMKLVAFELGTFHLTRNYPKSPFQSLVKIDESRFVYEISEKFWEKCLKRTERFLIQMDVNIREEMFSLTITKPMLLWSRIHSQMEVGELKQAPPPHILSGNA